jgi:hypothetical protein
MSLVSHETVCERRWDGHLAIVKIDDVSGFVDNKHFLYCISQIISGLHGIDDNNAIINTGT